MAYIVNVKQEVTEPRDLSQNILTKSMPQSSHMSLMNSSSPLPVLYQHLQQEYSLSNNAVEQVLVKVETNPCSNEIVSSSLTQAGVSCFINSHRTMQSNPTLINSHLKNIPTHMSIMPKTDLIPATSGTAHLEEISKIISSLPAGWKVVGLTDLSCDQSQINTNICNNSSSLEKVDNQNVSVNLTSTTQSGKISRNTPANKPIETIVSGDNSKMLHNSHQIILDSGIEPHVILNKEKPFTFSALDQQWTVIGVTSLPQTVGTPSIVTSTAAISSPIVTSKTNGLPHADTTKPNTMSFPNNNSNKTKIIPISATVLDKTKVMKVLPEHLLSLQSIQEEKKSESCSVSSLPKPFLDKNMLPYPEPNSHEEMKWTIVGITTSLPSETVNGDNSVAPASYQQAPIISSGSANNLQCKLSTQEIKTRIHNVPLPQNVNSRHYHKDMDNPVLHKQGSGPTLSVGSKHLSASNSQIRYPKVDFGESKLEESQWKIVGITSLNSPTVTNNSDTTSLPPHTVTNQNCPPISNKDSSSLCNLQPKIVTCTEPKAMAGKSSISNFSHPPLSKIDVLSKLNQKLLASNSSIKTQKLTDPLVIQDGSSLSNIPSVLTQPIHSTISSLDNTNSAASFSPDIKWSIVGIVANPCDPTSAPCLSKHDDTQCQLNRVLSPKETLNSLQTSHIGLNEQVKAHKSSCSDQIANYVKQFSRQSFVPKIPMKDQTRTSNRLIRTPFKQQMKLKDLLRKKGTAPPCIKPKKTVFSMLKHQRWTGGLSKDKNNDKVDCYQKNQKHTFYNDECDLSTHMYAEKSQRLRSLRTYNGNRDTFKKTSSETNIQLKNKDDSADIFPGERKRKRVDYNMDEDNDESGDNASPSTEISCLDVKTEKFESPEHSCEAEPVSEKDISPTKERSSSSKRKSKVPQKMVLDMDYQPFESSSDSN